jgi:hypothetical protein
MAALGSARELIARELQQAVDRLQQDIARVEFWADALGGFAKPIPDYEAASSRLNEFMLPRRGGDSRPAKGREQLEK